MSFKRLRSCAPQALAAAYKRNGRRVFFHSSPFSGAARGQQMVTLDAQTAKELGVMPALWKAKR